MLAVSLVPIIKLKCFVKKAPKHKINNDINSVKPKRSHEVIPLCYKMKIADLIMTEKSYMSKLAECSKTTNHQFVKQ